MDQARIAAYQTKLIDTQARVQKQDKKRKLKKNEGFILDGKFEGRYKREYGPECPRA